MGLLLVVIVVGGIISYAIWCYSRARVLLHRWAQTNGFDLLYFKLTFGGPFLWTSSNSQIVYSIRVRDQDGRERLGWVRCGSFWAGVLSDKTEVRWKSEI